MTFDRSNPESWAPYRMEDGRLPQEVEALFKQTMRWKCTYPGCGETARTRALHQPRLYSAFPRNGDSVRANIRYHLQGHRNLVESSFSWAKDNGVIGDHLSRQKWGGPWGEKWTIGLTFLSEFTKRLVLMDGQYEKSLALAALRGDIISPDTDVTAALNRQLGGPAPRIEDTLHELG